MDESIVDIDHVCYELKSAGFSVEERKHIRNCVADHDKLVARVAELEKALRGVKDMVQKTINVMKVLGLSDIHLIHYHETIELINRVTAKDGAE